MALFGKSVSVYCICSVSHEQKEAQQGKEAVGLEFLVGVWSRVGWSGVEFPTSRLRDVCGEV